MAPEPILVYVVALFSNEQTDLSSLQIYVNQYSKESSVFGFSVVGYRKQTDIEQV